MIELKGQIEADLNKALISSNILLNNFSFLDDRSRATGAYSDPYYIPFYYYLGKHTTPKNLLHAGFGLGTASGVFLIGCESVENFFAFQDPAGEYYTPRMGIKNIRRNYKKQFDFYVGSLDSEELEVKIKKDKWDLVIVTETGKYDQQRKLFDIVWSNVELHGLVVVDHINDEVNKTAFIDFCKIINREPVYIKTRYGIAIVER